MFANHFSSEDLLILFGHIACYNKETFLGCVKGSKYLINANVQIAVQKTNKDKQIDESICQICLAKRYLFLENINISNY